MHEDAGEEGGVDKGKGRERDSGSDVATSGLGPTVVNKAEDGPVWGNPFQVKWIRQERLPFPRLRHLRNPWNHNREVKVSRDGTELEPLVGQALVDEWDKTEP